MKTPEEVGKHAAWQAFFTSKTHKKMFTESSLAAHITGAVKGDRLARANKDWLIERAFERVGEEKPFSSITRSDIREWVELFAEIEGAE